MSAQIRFTAAVFGLFVLIVPATGAENEREIRAAVRRGVDYLKSLQTQAGYWRQNDPELHATRSRDAHALIAELEATRGEVTRLYNRWEDLAARSSDLKKGAR